MHSIKVSVFKTFAASKEPFISFCSVSCFFFLSPLIRSGQNFKVKILSIHYYRYCTALPFEVLIRMNFFIIQYFLTLLLFVCASWFSVNSLVEEYKKTGFFITILLIDRIVITALKNCSCFLWFFFHISFDKVNHSLEKAEFFVYCSMGGWMDEWMHACSMHVCALCNVKIRSKKKNHSLSFLFCDTGIALPFWQTNAVRH